MPEEKSEKLTGICLYFIEQGSGGVWAFQDSIFMTPSPWSFKGLHILKNGDHLTIFSPGDLKKVVWSGTIELVRDECKLPRKDKVVGSWFCQKGIGRDVWPKWFVDKYPAELIPVPVK